MLQPVFEKTRLEMLIAMQIDVYVRRRDNALNSSATRCNTLQSMCMLEEETMQIDVYVRRRVHVCVCYKTRLGMLIAMQNQILDGHHTFLFKWLI